ncbi:Zinc-finger domain of monoamine-oxidase A repressor R1 protein [Hirschfeldia incana]|nr:Zinc-finger domain of monoamine-oxidase A repressor R1 protein [Hirschfeldia incana]
MALDASKPSKPTKKPTKRKTNPGVRVVGGRIYDSSNGKCCHQCRQKTMDFVASCKGMKNDKQCKLNYCHTCLLNRYGEKAEEVANLNDWHCPKCRGLCNCSFCRKERGLNPTGILSHRAKASGLSSVSELLQVEGVDSFAYSKKEDISIEDVGNEDNKAAGKKKKAKTGLTKANLDGASIEDVTKENSKAAGKIKKAKATNEVKEEEIQIEAKLPVGISLTNVAGIDIPSEETGNVLQFLEFCSAFGEVLDLKEGQAESIVSELFSCGRSTRRQQYCSVIPMMIQLLELISNDRDMSLSLSATDSTWFSSLGDCILQSGVLSDVFPPVTFTSGVSEYKKMDASSRLKLLNFLCDESLSTFAMRNFIETKSVESEAQRREAKEKAAVAKEKEKQLRQKMQGDLVKAHIDRNGAPLSIEEHQAILTQIKAEVKEAHDKMLEAKGMISTKRQRCDAAGTDPILLNDDGLVLWKLKCFEEEPKFLLQELGIFGDLSLDEKWLAFKPEQKQEVEKYISAKG